MSKYILKKDCSLGKSGDKIVWSKESQLEVAAMFGKTKEDVEKWRDEFFMEMPEGIYWTEKTIKAIHCNHPLVERIWEHGGMAQIPTNGQVIRSICLLIKGSENNPIQFDDYGDGSAIEQAEAYLSNLAK